MLLPTLGPRIRQLCQCFGLRDAHSGGNSRYLQYFRADLSTKFLAFIDPGQVGKCFVDLKARCQAMDMNVSPLTRLVKLEAMRPWKHPFRLQLSVVCPYDIYASYLTIAFT